MNVLEMVTGTINHYTDKLPRWANALICLWILFAGLAYFDLIHLPEMGWWRTVVMAPMVIAVLAVFLQMMVFIVSWLTAPARWLLKKWKAAKHG